MKFMRIAALAVVLAVVAVAAGCGGDADRASQPAEIIHATIGTGDVTGLYYPIGVALAKIVNENNQGQRLRCTAESTVGSVYNINTLLAGGLQLGIVQSDRQHQAVSGASEWQADGPQRELRACFALHCEAVTLVAAVDAEIVEIADLRGKRVNLGNPGSGQRQNALDALEAAGMDPSRDILADNVTPAAAPGLLQEGRIDAFFYTVGHPNGALKEAVSGPRKVRLIPLRVIDRLIGAHPYYTRSRIRVKYYPGLENTADVETFGVKATVVTAAKVPETVVYAVVKAVFERLETLKTMHPVLRDLTATEMLEGLSAPFHPGALKYYREVGLVN